MQTSGTFPELYAGRKDRPRRGTGRYAAADKGVTGFAVTGPKPRPPVKNASSFAGRRAASRRAHGR